MNIERVSLQRVKSFDEGVKNKMYGAKNVHLRPQTKFRVGGGGGGTLRAFSFIIYDDTFVGDI